ncbi:MAG: hypothetical protein M3P22_02215 [bacterium]|nr:hypothetical protein [bacterium]
MSIFADIFGKSKNTNDIVLIFDIGSSSVGGAFFHIQKGGAPNIIFSTREPLLLEEKVEVSKLFELAVKALKVVATRASIAGIGSPTKIFCVLSSPWYASQTRVIKLTKDTPFIFTKEFADSLIGKEVDLFEEEYGSLDGHTTNKVKTIEIKNMKTLLNGYVSNDPINKKIKEIGMTIFISMSHEDIFKKIEEAVKRHFNAVSITFSSFLMASFAVGRSLFINQDNFLLVNIGGEITEISMIKKDIISDSSSFPLGRNFIIRGVAKELQISLDEARSIISLYKDAHIEKSYVKNVDEVMLKLKNEWLKSFQTTLTTLSKDISIPSTVFITVSEDLALFFSDTIRTEQFNQYSLTESKFRVIFLNTQSLHGIATFDDQAQRDVPLLIESIYINHFLV